MLFARLQADLLFSLYGPRGRDGSRILAGIALRIAGYMEPAPGTESPAVLRELRAKAEALILLAKASQDEGVRWWGHHATVEHVMGVFRTSEAFASLRGAVTTEVAMQAAAWRATEHLRTMDMLRLALSREMQMASEDADQQEHETRTLRLLISSLRRQAAERRADAPDLDFAA